jgi:peptidoglycan/xylan/chitin deacetylase (PgdA/CDA1 family)
MSKAIILMYHNIGIPPKGSRIPNLFVTPRMFRFQMGYLRLAGFKVLPLSDLITEVSGGIQARNLAAITFDDGYVDFYRNAYPILKQSGYPSTVYVVSGLVGRDNVWDAANENTAKPLMDWDMIREVSANGVRIGSHTKSHPQLTTLEGPQLEAELRDSKKTLEDQLGLAVDDFCYPYGDHNSVVRDAVQQAGYRTAVTTQRGHVTEGQDPFLLRRIPIKLITNPASFLYKIHTNAERRKGRQP